MIEKALGNPGVPSSELVELLELGEDGSEKIELIEGGGLEAFRGMASSSFGKGDLFPRYLIETPQFAEQNEAACNSKVLFVREPAGDGGEFFLAETHGDFEPGSGAEENLDAGLFGGGEVMRLIGPLDTPVGGLKRRASLLGVKSLQSGGHLRAGVGARGTETQ